VFEPRRSARPDGHRAGDYPRLTTSALAALVAARRGDLNPAIAVERRLLGDIVADMTAPDWIEHRRGDGEHVGWMVPADGAFHVVDLLGRQRTHAPVDWHDAEEALEALGIGYLADRYSLRLASGEERRVRIGEVSASGIIVLTDTFGSASAIGAHPEEFELPFPAPEDLRSLD
jgi:hypothetical protein